MSAEMPTKDEIPDFIYHTIVCTEKDVVLAAGSPKSGFIEYHLLDKRFRVRSTLTISVFAGIDQYIHQMNVVKRHRVRLIIGSSAYKNVDLLMIKNSKLVAIQTRLPVFNARMYQFKTLSDEVIVHGLGNKIILLKLGSD